MDCIYCNREEPGYTPSKDATAIVCSDCTMRLASSSQEQLVKLHKLAVEKGYTEKADALERMINSKGHLHGRKTGKTGTDTKRRTPLRMAKPADSTKRREKQAA